MFQTTNQQRYHNFSRSGNDDTRSLPASPWPLPGRWKTKSPPIPGRHVWLSNSRANPRISMESDGYQCQFVSIYIYIQIHEHMFLYQVCWFIRFEQVSVCLDTLRYFKILPLPQIQVSMQHTFKANSGTHGRQKLRGGPVQSQGSLSPRSCWKREARHSTTK